MTVRAGKQHRPGGRTVRRDMEVGEENPFPRQGVDIGCPDLAPEQAEVVERQVIHHDEQYVRTGVSAAGCVGTGA